MLLTGQPVLCGHNLESNEHYFLRCPLYNNMRIDLFETINDRFGITGDNISVRMLLEGSDALDIPNNKELFDIIHKFIEDTGRL